MTYSPYKLAERFAGRHSTTPKCSYGISLSTVRVATELKRGLHRSHLITISGSHAVLGPAVDLERKMTAGNGNAGVLARPGSIDVVGNRLFGQVHL